MARKWKILIRFSEKLFSHVTAIYLADNMNSQIYTYTHVCRSYFFFGKTSIFNYKLIIRQQQPCAVENRIATALHAPSEMRNRRCMSWLYFIFSNSVVWIILLLNGWEIYWRRKLKLFVLCYVGCFMCSAFPAPRIYVPADTWRIVAAAPSRGLRAHVFMMMVEKINYIYFGNYFTPSQKMADDSSRKWNFVFFSENFVFFHFARLTLKRRFSIKNGKLTAEKTKIM
jgi:hypothetical protein